MEKVTKTVYVAEDGKEFLTIDDCEKYEKRLASISILKSLIPTIREICREHDDCDCDCPFYHRGGYFCIIDGCPNAWTNAEEDAE